MAITLLRSMSARNRNRIFDNEIEALLEEEDSDSDILDVESSSSKSSTDSNQRAYSSSDSDDYIALPTDWIAGDRERNPFIFRSDHGVKFTVEDKDI